MRVVLTGAGGFVGGAVARLLRSRGDDVIAPIRDPARATPLREIGVEVVQDDLSDVETLARLLHGADAAIHAAGSYRVGIRQRERAAMWAANVGTTTSVLDAAQAARLPRIVYVSTLNVFGNTRGRLVEETYRRDPAQGFLSWYDETKFRAHEVAEERIAGGAPVVIAMPSQVYGPGDPSAVGEQLARAHAGRLAYRALDDVGLCLVHVDDLATGIVAALDQGQPGEAYALAGPAVRLAEAIDLAAEIGGHTPPGFRIPTGLLRTVARVGPLVGQPNLNEVIAASAGVTYWATADKARAALGFAPRPIREGLVDTFGLPEASQRTT